jgi:hypothetical protein
MAALVIRNVAFFGMVGFAILEVLFIVGEYWADPGGVEAIVGSIGVIGTILGVSLWALLSPHTARYYLWGTVVVIALVSLWWALAPRFVMDVMDERGPLVPVAAIIAAVPIVFWGRRDWLYTRRAGVALILVAVLPIAGVAASPEDVARGVLGAVAIMTGPYAVGGLLYVVADRWHTLFPYEVAPASTRSSRMGVWTANQGASMSASTVGSTHNRGRDGTPGAMSGM